MAEAPTPGAPRRITVAEWLEGSVVVLITGAFALSAAHLTAWDRPVGDGWSRYLGNAIAIRDHAWSGYLRWRGPVHAWLCLMVMPLAGSLVRASQVVSFVAATATLPITWALGRRLGGRATGLLALGVLAAWPDLPLFARFSSPYSLDAFLLVLATLLALDAGSFVRRNRIGSAIAAGVVLGIGVGTDLRFLPLTAAVATGAALAPRASSKRAAVLIPLLALPLGYALVSSVPVSLYSLGEQVALQRDAAAATVSECARRGPQPPLLADAFGACGRALVALNLANATAAVCIPLTLLALLLMVGAWAAGREERWRAALLVLPVLTLVPSLAIIVVQHRYLVPVAPLVAVLVAAGLARGAAALDARMPSIAPGFTLGAGLLVAGLGLAWGASPTTLRARFVAHLRSGDRVVDAADAITAAWRPGDRVVDCANGNLRERLYPIPVEERRARDDAARAQCNGVLGTPPTAPTWVLVRESSVPAGWNAVPLGGPGPDNAAGIVLLRGDGD